MILIDRLRHYRGRTRYLAWCHMVSDESEEELHSFARLLGLRRSWFQDDEVFPHYDLIPNKRHQAIRLGAVSVSARELVRRMRDRYQRVLLSRSNSQGLGSGCFAC